MFTIETIKSIIDGRQFQKGRAYCRNGRVRSFRSEMTLKNICVVNAEILTNDKYDVSLKIDIETGNIIDWECVCADGAVQICRHVAAAAVYLCEHDDELVAFNEFNSGYEKRIYNELGLNPLSSDGKIVNDSINVIFLEFNIGNAGIRRSNAGNMIQARDLKFSIRIVSNNNYEYGIKIDRGLLGRSTGQMSLFLEYTSINAIYQSGNYIFGQMNFDTMISIASGLDTVMYGIPPKKILISGEEYFPDISVAYTPDGSAVITDTNSVEMIPGKYSLFILKDDVLMRLGKNVPHDFMYNLNRRILLDPVKTQIAQQSVFPAMREVYNARIDDQDSEDSVVRTVLPEVNIYISLDEEDDKMYIIPEISYEKYLTINPFHPDHAASFINHHSVMTDIKAMVRVKSKDGYFIFFRKTEKERKVFEFFSCWFGETERQNGKLPAGTTSNIYTLFSKIIPLIPSDWKIYYDEKMSMMKPKKADVMFDFDFSDIVDNRFLEFNIDFHCNSMNINRQDLMEYIRNNQNLLFINGQFIEVTNRQQLLELLNLLETFDASDDDSFSDRIYRITELSPHIKSGSVRSLTCKEEISRLIEEAENRKPVEEVTLPDSFSTVLREYQKDGVLWMHFLRKYRFGGILADDMGLGKTLQALVMISVFSSERPSLVVCPKTLIFNWAAEAVKFAPDIPVYLIQGNHATRRHLLKKIPDKGLIITSYPLLQRDIDQYKKVDFEYCIIDEAQKIKNNDTQNAKCVKQIKSEYKLALTGTPLENNINELWSIFDFVMPGFLGSESNFINRFEPREGHGRSLVELRNTIRPFVIRRTKTEMLKELPPKVEQSCYAQMTKAQLALYARMLEKVRGEVFNTVSEKGFGKSQIQILAGLTRLRQICDHPGLLNTRLQEHDDMSGKMELFAELLDECLEGGHRVLVFSQFVKMLDILQKYLEKCGISYQRLDGSTKDRQSVIEQFSEDSSISIFLISLKAGGLGLNLTSADTVILYDPWWNPMVEEQAMDRAYRMGQSKTVNVYKLITKGSIEEKIQLMQQRKKFLFNSVISETGDYMNKMTWEDIKEILS